ncbi:Radical SAM domain protein [Methylorubrum extorquens DSM 13060]|uniref:Radical SAM domain protein n=1 Tax=Methylorubrum extorquens DSM 13060 TaxID=882800 RepID=H1KHW0_METEX|nr:Radical SAM domain protein [Methylorubrum extorquens DSM 13060]
MATRSAIRETAPARLIRDLDAYRIGWELIDHARYSYWGGLRAVVVQFSRGCPHPCTYCGQRGFWTRWRHRDPVRFAAELARLHREHGVRVINFADENPTVSKKVWRGGSGKLHSGAEWNFCLTAARMAADQER